MMIVGILTDERQVSSAWDFALVGDVKSENITIKIKRYIQSRDLKRRVRKPKWGYLCHRKVLESVFIYLLTDCCAIFENLELENAEIIG